MAEQCGDNRFLIIERAKKDLIESTNIETSPDEMKVLDSILFRAWQMNWLERYNKEKEEAEIIAKKMIDAILYDNDIVNRMHPFVEEIHYGAWLINITQALIAPVMQLGKEFFTDEFIDMFAVGDDDEMKAAVVEYPILSYVNELLNQYFDNVETTNN